MSVVEDIKRLRATRFEHEAAIKAIDAQLEDVRTLVAGMDVRNDAPASRRSGSRPGRSRRISDPDHLSRTERQILDSLAEIQPQTVKMLDSRIDVATVGLNMKPLLARGLVVRRLFKIRSERYQRYPYWYALSSEPLDRLEQELSVSGQLQDTSLDPSNPSANSVAGGISSDTERNGFERTTAGVVPPFAMLNTESGNE